MAKPTRVPSAARRRTVSLLSLTAIVIPAAVALAAIAPPALLVARAAVAITLLRPARHRVYQYAEFAAHPLGVKVRRRNVALRLDGIVARHAPASTQGEFCVAGLS